MPKEERTYTGQTFRGNPFAYVPKLIFPRPEHMPIFPRPEPMPIFP
jgi:hypothetical protein